MRLRILDREISLATFRALRHKNCRLFFFGQGLSVIGTWMQAMAQGWLAYELTNSKFLLGVIAALGMFPLSIFSLVGGVCRR